LKKFLGEEWLNRKIGKVRLSGYNNTNPMLLADMDIHPLVKAIIDTQIKLSVLEQKGIHTVPVGRAETFQELLHENLTAIEEKINLQDIQRRLRDKNEFPKVEYEIAIAAGYKRMGYEVDFIPRTADSRTAEFYVTDKKNQRVLVECKKKDMTLRAEQKINSWWEEFQHLTMSSLKKEGKCYGIIVAIPQNPDRSDTHKLKDEILTLANSDTEGEFTFLNDKYKVTLKRFCNMGESIPSEVFESFANAGDFNHAVGSMKHDKNAWPLGKELAEEYSDPIGIYSIGPSDFVDERVTGIVSTVGDAYGQLSEEISNLVYIDINIASMTPDTARKVLTQLIPAIHKKLNRDYSNISAVILTNLKILGHSDISGFHADEHVIHNPNAKHKLPDSFSIYGDLKNGQSILEDVGNLLKK